MRNKVILTQKQSDRRRTSKPSLMELRRTYNQDRKTLLTSEMVADTAGVPLWLEYQVEIRVPVTRKDAEKILAAFSKLVDHTYTVEDVEVRLKAETV